MEAIYFKTGKIYIKNYAAICDKGYVKIAYSDHEPSNPDTAKAVLLMTIFNQNGEDIDSYELDITKDSGDLHDYIDGLKAFADMDIDFMTEIPENEFDELIASVA